MAQKSTRTTSTSWLTARTQIVWGSFFVAMTSVTGLLALGGEPIRPGFVAANQVLIDDSAASDPVLQTRSTLDRSRWRAIVIHDSGGPAGDEATLDRFHQSVGLDGLGFHFVIGNGNGMGNGELFVGYRWNEQLPGDHVTGRYADTLNRSSVGICLIGNGDRRTFTDDQIGQLVKLIRRLQVEMGIPRDAVHLHRDVADGVASPGRFFPEARLREQLLD